MKIEATPAVVVDLRDSARPPSRDESIEGPSRTTGKVLWKPAAEPSQDRVALWYASLEVAAGLEGMYYFG